MTNFPFNEKYLSQIPAIQVLMNAGYEYLSPEAALKERQGKLSQVLLEGILRGQLKRINRIHYKNGEYLFSEESIQSAIQKLKNIDLEAGKQNINQAAYDLLTLGTSEKQNIDGDSKSFTLNYIDWKDFRRNVFHVTSEFSVERTRSTETCRPDIVLFVNGIPLVVLECKSPKEEIEQAVSQSIRNQSDEFIPKLFMYSQLVVGMNKNEARYATSGSPKDFWAVWKEQRDCDSDVAKIVNAPLSEAQKAQLFSGNFKQTRAFFDSLQEQGGRLMTQQDRTIYSLCRPERLLDLTYGFTLFDSGIKKIARYQQYFVIKSTLERIKQFDDEGRRQGGIIWHTQGSGKSLTMVMLARSLALDPAISDPRIVLVTDRTDLDDQLKNTFVACGLDPNRATSGRNLLELVAETRAGIVTTLIHKFDKALNVQKFRDGSPDIFMLIDESHRTNFGSFSARMRQMFPKACYLGFTGTPLLKKEKNNFLKFGGLIEPHYSINQAVEDKAVVPLFYEGRHVEMKQDKRAIDLWFERHTQGLTTEQKADLKKEYARAEMLNKAEQVIYMRAFDISEHFRETFQATGLKGQLVAPNKASALRYHEYLKSIGYVTSEVMISAPDQREGYEEVDEEPTDEVIKFWKKMMTRYGSKEEYEKQIINQFKNGDEPEILIVVNKLLTGFDAPRNAVLYLCAKLREHALLQAIARVNRIEERKEFGLIVDYASILGELDKALTMYSEFEGFDEEDLQGTLTSINAEIEKLPQRYSDLWDLFKEVKGSYDEEAYEMLLADQALREEFYERLSVYGKTLATALSAERFIMSVEEDKLKKYKEDLKKFHNLRAAVRTRYQESIDYGDYEPKIKKLLDTHIQANEAIRLNEPINIFDDRLMTMVRSDQEDFGKTTAAKADAIAHATKKVITEKMGEDPAFYEKLSRLIQQVIDDFRARRISELEYFKQANEIRDTVVTRRHDDVPDQLKDNEDATAYYGVLKLFFSAVSDSIETEALTTEMALAVERIFERNWKVHFWSDPDAPKQVVNEIDDYLFDEIKGRQGIELSPDQMDDIIDRVMQVARHRRKG